MNPAIFGRSPVPGCVLALSLLSAACTGSLEPAGQGSASDAAAAAGSGGPTGSGGSASGSVGGSSDGVGGDTTSSSTSASGSTGSGGVTVPKEEVAVNEFTRLTRAEYHATVLDALGISADVNLIPEDGRIGPFTSNVRVTPDPVHPYLLVAEELARAAIPDELPACEADAATACIEQEYRQVLERLYRRPLTEADISSAAQVIEEVVQGAGTALDATRAMLAAALLSPDFLYRATPSNSGEPAFARRIAERLSYALWDAPPDAELSEAIAAGTSDLEAVLQSEGARLTSSERAIPIFARFLGQWLDVDTDLRLENPSFASSPDYLELLAFVQAAVAQGVSAKEFVKGTTGFVHRDNLDIYALEDIDDADDVAQIEWPASSNRRGLLGQELVVGSTRHPDLSRREIFRGLLVRRHLLCDEIPAPDADLVALAGEVGDRTEDSRCRTCHQLMDPIGRAFAVLDQDIDEPAPLPEVIGHTELAGSYTSLGELLDAVADSRAFAECFSRHWLAFFLELPLSELDDAWVTGLADSVENGASLVTLVDQTISELHTRSRALVPWCTGE